MLRESKSMRVGLLVMKQSISVTVINVNINCKNGINMIFSPKTAFFTVGVAHTTPLYKGECANEESLLFKSVLYSQWTTERIATQLTPTNYLQLGLHMILPRLWLLHTRAVSKPSIHEPEKRICFFHLGEVSHASDSTASMTATWNVHRQALAIRN